MKLKIAKAVALALAMACLICFPVPASANAQGTEGTELEVIQPQNLEVQLGESWAGVEFELKTDAGMYPGVITVGEDGVLRLEIGGSENYILSCLNSTVEVPIPGETLPTEDEPTPAGESNTELSENTVPTADPTERIDPEHTGSEKEAEGTVAGIPIAHLALFGGGLVVAVGSLVGIHFYQKKRQSSAFNEYDENDEI